MCYALVACGWIARHDGVGCRSRAKTKHKHERCRPQPYRLVPARAKPRRPSQRPPRMTPSSPRPSCCGAPAGSRGLDQAPGQDEHRFGQCQGFDRGDPQAFPEFSFEPSWYPIFFFCFVKLFRPPTHTIAGRSGGPQGHRDYPTGHVQNLLTRPGCLPTHPLQGDRRNGSVSGNLSGQTE